MAKLISEIISIIYCDSRSDPSDLFSEDTLRIVKDIQSGNRRTAKLEHWIEIANAAARNINSVITPDKPDLRLKKTTAAAIITATITILENIETAQHKRRLRDVIFRKGKRKHDYIKNFEVVKLDSKPTFYSAAYTALHWVNEQRFVSCGWAYLFIENLVAALSEIPKQSASNICQELQDYLPFIAGIATGHGFGNPMDVYFELNSRQKFSDWMSCDPGFGMSYKPQ